MTLGVLDFGTIKLPEYSAPEAISDIMELVVKAEQLGYKRFWLAEHFSPDCAWAFPESLIPLMAGYTEHINIGIAGVLLNYLNPFQVANTFKLLSLLYPGRIDLGVARGGIAPAILKALKVELTNDPLHIEQQVGELISYLKGSEEIPFPNYGNLIPGVWQLCSSPGVGLDMAIRYQSNLCVSLIHKGSNIATAREVIDRFRREGNQYMECCVALNVYCSEDKDKVAAKVRDSNNNPYLANLIAGNKAYITRQIHDLQDKLGVHNFVIYVPAYEYSSRVETLEQLSEAFL